MSNNKNTHKTPPSETRTILTGPAMEGAEPTVMEGGTAETPDGCKATGGKITLGTGATLSLAKNAIARVEGGVLPARAAALGIKTGMGDNDVGHSDDFRSLKWFGETYSFTVNQAPVVKMLYENWQNGTPDVGNETLLSAVDHEFPPERLSVLFRDHPAWGTIIVSGTTKGTRKLQSPQKI